MDFRAFLRQVEVRVVTSSPLTTNKILREIDFGHIETRKTAIFLF